MGELLNLVGLSTGVVLYAMLLRMVALARQRRATDGSLDRLPFVTAILGLAWNLCAIPLYELPNLGIRGPLPGLSAIGFSALGFLPAVVVHSVLRGEDHRVRGAAKRALTVAGYAASTFAAVAHTVAWWADAPVPSPRAMQVLSYTFMAIVVPVGIVTRRQPGARRALWIAALAIFAASALHLTQLHTGHDPWLTELLGHHASLPLALAILYQDYPFAFADLFLKRALTIVTLVTVALLGIAMGGLASRSQAHLSIVGPFEISAVVIFWVATALLYPRLRHGVSWFVDTVVLGRPDYRSLRIEVATCVQRRNVTPDLLDEVCQLLAPVLGGGVARWHERADVSTPDLITAGPLVFQEHTSATVTIPTADRPQFAIVAGPLQGGRRLLSDDVTVLEGLAISVARRIDAIRFLQVRHEHELREQEASTLAVEAELRALRAQINPHFLFNALTTIGYLIQTAPPRALTTLMRLTTLLRSVLRSEGAFTTLDHELEIIEAYLDIERARFEDRLRVRVDVPVDLRGVRVPPLILQPLVENAIKHGVAPHRGGGDVLVRARVNRKGADQYELSMIVHDTGTGTTDVELQGRRERGLGLRNVEQRLACHYGNEATLSIHSRPGQGTTAEIRMPVAVWIDEPAVDIGA